MGTDDFKYDDLVNKAIIFTHLIVKSDIHVVSLKMMKVIDSNLDIKIHFDVKKTIYRKTPPIVIQKFKLIFFQSIFIFRM